jgi:hypothetical protein
MSLAAITQAHAQVAQTAPAAPTNSKDNSIALDTISVTDTKTEEKVIAAVSGVSTVTPGRRQPAPAAVGAGSD